MQSDAQSRKEVEKERAPVVEGPTNQRNQSASQQDASKGSEAARGYVPHREHLSISRRDSSLLKPAVPQKSALILKIAREMLQKRRGKLKRSTSDSELYDDATSYRSFHASEDASEDETYDDVISVLASGDDEIYDDVVTLLAETDDAEIYDDIISMMAEGSDSIYNNIAGLLLDESMKAGAEGASRVRPVKPVKPAWLAELPRTKPKKQVSRRHSFEDIYDDTVVAQVREKVTSSAKPHPPDKPTKLEQHPAVKKLLQRLREKGRAKVATDTEQGPSDPGITQSLDSSSKAESLIAVTGVPDEDGRVFNQPMVETTIHTETTGARSKTQPHDHDVIHHSCNGVLMPGSGQQGDDVYLNLLPPSPAPPHRKRLQPSQQQEVGEQMQDGAAASAVSPISQSSHGKTEESPYENESIVEGRRVQYREIRKSKVNFASLSFDEGTGSSDTLCSPTSERSKPPPKPLRKLQRARSCNASFSNTLDNLIPSDPPDSPSTPTAASHLPAGRAIYDPLPDIEEARPHYVEYLASLRNPESIVEEADPYEYLPLYEDLHQYQMGEDKEVGYQDLDGAVTAALGLPEHIRRRAKRITPRQRSKLQKSIKRTRGRIERSQTMPARDLSERLGAVRLSAQRHVQARFPAIAEESRTHSNPELNSNTEDAKDKDSCVTGTEEESTRHKEEQGDVAVSETATAEGERGGGGGEEGGSDSESDEDGPIPFGKSREVFEMLLDASGIQRAPTGSSETDQTEKPLPLADDDGIELSGDEASATCTRPDGETNSSPFFDDQELDRLYDTPELRDYQEAGIIQPRSKSELDEEIRQITAKAPAVPPPLPGYLRPRARVMTRTDKILHKRFLLKRRQRLQNTPAVLNASKNESECMPPPPLTPPPPSNSTFNQPPPPPLTPPPPSNSTPNQPPPPPPASNSIPNQLPPSLTPPLTPNLTVNQPPPPPLTPPPPSRSTPNQPPPPPLTLPPTSNFTSTQPPAILLTPPPSDVTYQNLSHAMSIPAGGGSHEHELIYQNVSGDSPQPELTYQNLSESRPHSHLDASERSSSARDPT